MRFGNSGNSSFNVSITLKAIYVILARPAPAFGIQYKDYTLTMINNTYKGIITSEKYLHPHRQDLANNKKCERASQCLPLFYMGKGSSPSLSTAL